LRRTFPSRRRRLLPFSQLGVDRIDRRLHASAEAHKAIVHHSVSIDRPLILQAPHNSQRTRLTTARINIDVSGYFVIVAITIYKAGLSGGKIPMATALGTCNAAEAVEEQHEIGLRQRKKARLRQQIIDTSIRLFRKHGYEETRIDDIVQVLDISQPTFFRYFPSKDAVLRTVGERGYACICDRLRSELSSKADTRERLRRLYVTMAREVENDRKLWQAVVLSGAMDPVRSVGLRGHEEAAASLLREILTQGQKRGEVTRTFPVVHLAEFMEGLYNTVVRQWAVDLTGPHKLTDRVRSAVEFFLRGIRP
jgi:AcrR family transcriptional regulator